MKDFKNILPPRQPRDFFSNGQALQAVAGFVFMLFLMGVCGWSVIEVPAPPRPYLSYPDKHSIYQYSKAQFQADAERYYNMMELRGMSKGGETRSDKR